MVVQLTGGIWAFIISWRVDHGRVSIVYLGIATTGCVIDVV
jgi:hypothetical protein